MVCRASCAQSGVGAHQGQRKASATSPSLPAWATAGGARLRLSHLVLSGGLGYPARLAAIKAANIHFRFRYEQTRAGNSLNNYGFPNQDVLSWGQYTLSGDHWEQAETAACGLLGSSSSRSPHASSSPLSASPTSQGNRILAWHDACDHGGLWLGMRRSSRVEGAGQV